MQKWAENRYLLAFFGKNERKTAVFNKNQRKNRWKSFNNAIFWDFRIDLPVKGIRYNKNN